MPREINEEYTTPNDQTCTLQSQSDGTFSVGMWNEDDSCHWYLTFPTEDAARVEFNRWRT